MRILIGCSHRPASSLAFVDSPVPVTPKGIRSFAGVGKESPYRSSAFLALDPAAATRLLKSLLTPPTVGADYVPSNWPDPPNGGATDSNAELLARNVERTASRSKATLLPC